MPLENISALHQNQHKFIFLINKWDKIGSSNIVVQTQNLHIPVSLLSVLFIFIMLFNVKINNILKLFSTDFILRKRVIGFADVNLILIMIMTRSLHIMSYNTLYDIKALSTKKPNPTPTPTQTEIKFSY